MSDYDDFGVVELEIEDRLAALELPNVRPNAFLLDVVAAGQGGVTHFYFGLQTDPISVDSSVPGSAT